MFILVVKIKDKWVIEDIFKFKTNGYFVDLAATNGLFENNTYVLEKNILGLELR